MKLSENDLRLIKTISDSYGIDVRIYKDYSGKFMYGAKTIGLVFRSNMDYAQLLVEVACKDKDIAVVLATAMVDDLGKDLIYY